MARERKLQISVPVAVGLKRQVPSNVVNELFKSDPFFVTSDGEIAQDHWYGENDVYCGSQELPNYGLHDTLAIAEQFAKETHGFAFPAFSGINLIQHQIREILDVQDEQGESKSIGLENLVGALRACIPNIKGIPGFFDRAEEREKAFEIWTEKTAVLEGLGKYTSHKELKILRARRSSPNAVMLMEMGAGKYEEGINFAVAKLGLGGNESLRSSVRIDVEPKRLIGGEFGSIKHGAYLTPGEVLLLENATATFIDSETPAVRERVKVKYDREHGLFVFGRDDYRDVDVRVPVAEVIETTYNAARFMVAAIRTRLRQHEVAVSLDSQGLYAATRSGFTLRQTGSGSK